MISILAQERILGAALGSACVGTIVFEQRRGIHGSIADDKSDQIKKFEKQNPSGKNITPDLAIFWNKAIDGTLGQLVAYLSLRRW
ncbi:uncharacterized protein LOC110035540 isoform X2 [Phalaenopsis equestris]|uniref:uncharacterized protein LOC110035540 isoform X2 n=1 Tax=Phalaenopsis equestris TaxID=78828 RepID=UPI0009E2270B|nr:uncharacterized protein LOC110035540 isoform X2 [Phalaenopsis equestris]